jgi:hypothetical protein
MRIDDPAVDLASLARAQGVAAAGPIASAADLSTALEEAIRTVEGGRPYALDLMVLPGAAPLLKRA